jgi:hypothetical protein
MVLGSPNHGHGVGVAMPGAHVRVRSAQRFAEIAVQ